MPTVLVANRGEIAVRVIAAAHKMGMKAVAVYSEADADLPHVAAADEAICLGPGRAQDSYLNIAKVLEAATSSGADLVHPGYGFLSENPRFANACSDAGLTFVGPSAEHIALMGDKESARAAAIAAGVPVLPGTDRLPESEEAVVALARKVGFPLLVKAVAGGGGQGMRRVENEDKLLPAIKQTQKIAGRSFGDAGVYMERFLDFARHVEVQIFGFGNGKALHLFERDCTVQRRHQKIIEEAPAPNITTDVRSSMTEAALKLVRSIQYSGVGTIEFLYDPAREEFYFLEMNTRIQVEHPVTEAITGTDLVAAQLLQSIGQDPMPALNGGKVEISGHAIEARVYAENPEKQFLPSPGPLDRLALPSGEGLRVDTGYREGNEVTPFYDSMLMKIISHGADRHQALARLVRGLEQLEIAGIASNRSFLQNLLQSKEVSEATYHTRMLD